MQGYQSRRGQPCLRLDPGACKPFLQCCFPSTLHSTSLNHQHMSHFPLYGFCNLHAEMKTQWSINCDQSKSPQRSGAASPYRTDKAQHQTAIDSHSESTGLQDASQPFIVTHRNSLSDFQLPLGLTVQLCDNSPPRSVGFQRLALGSPSRDDPRILYQIAEFGLVSSSSLESF